MTSAQASSYLRQTSGEKPKISRKIPLVHEYRVITQAYAIKGACALNVNGKGHPGRNV